MFGERVRVKRPGLKFTTLNVFCRLNCLFVTCTDRRDLAEGGGAKGVPSDEWHLFRPVGLRFAHTETDGCHLSFGGLPDALSEALTGAWRARSFRGVLMNGPRLKRDKSKSRQRKNWGEQEAQFQRFWKNPQSLSFNPSWQGWGSIHLTLSFSPSLFSLSLSFSPFSSGSVGSCSGGATAWVLRSVFCVLRDTHTEQLITMPCWRVKAALILCVLEVCLPRLHRGDCTSRAWNNVCPCLHLRLLLFKV